MAWADLHAPSEVGGLDQNVNSNHDNYQDNKESCCSLSSRALYTHFRPTLTLGDGCHCPGAQRGWKLSQGHPGGKSRTRDLSPLQLCQTPGYMSLASPWQVSDTAFFHSNTLRHFWHCTALQTEEGAVLLPLPLTASGGKILVKVCLLRLSPSHTNPAEVLIDDQPQ